MFAWWIVCVNISTANGRNRVIFRISTMARFGVISTAVNRRAIDYLCSPIQQSPASFRRWLASRMPISLAVIPGQARGFPFWKFYF